MTTATTLQLSVKLTIDRGNHPALDDKSVERVYALLTTIDGQRVQLAPTKTTTLEVSWTDVTVGDWFGIYVIFRARQTAVSILAATQAYFLDAKHNLVMKHNESFPRSFGDNPHPLMPVKATVGAGTARIDASLNTRILDLTDHILALDAGPFSNAMTLDPWQRASLGWMRKTYADNEGCDIRVLGVVQAVADKDPNVFENVLTPLAVVIPPESALERDGKAVTDPGALVFYGPLRQKPFLLTNPVNWDSYFGYFDGLRRYLKAPGVVTKDVVIDGATVAKTGERLAFFGPTIDEESDPALIRPDGIWPASNPNCSLAPMLARANKPVILIVTWGEWPKVNRKIAGDVIRFLWGDDKIARFEDTGVKLGRFGIAGFSLGGGTCMKNIDDECDEVYLFDPNTHTDNASGWFNKAPAKRRLRLVSGYFYSGILLQVKGAVSGSVTTVNGKPNFSWLPSAMLDPNPSKPKQPFMLDYYSYDKGHPSFVAAYRWYLKTPPVSAQPGSWHDASKAWRAHQWVVMGGEIGGGADHTALFTTLADGPHKGEQVLAADYRTFFGQCLELSDY